MVDASKRANRGQGGRRRALDAPVLARQPNPVVTLRRPERSPWCLYPHTKGNIFRLLVQRPHAHCPCSTKYLVCLWFLMVKATSRGGPFLSGFGKYMVFWLNCNKQKYLFLVLAFSSNSVQRTHVIRVTPKKREVDSDEMRKFISS